MGFGSFLPACARVRTMRSSVALAGEALDEPVGLEDADVGEAIEDRATRRAGSGRARRCAARRGAGSCWAPGSRPRRQLADRELAGRQRLEHAQALGVRQRPTDRGIPLAVELARGREVVVSNIALNHVTVCANTQVTFVRESRRRLCHTPRRGRPPTGSSSLAAIHAARERIAGRVHRTPMLSSRPRPGRSRRPAARASPTARLYVKAEHLQKTGSFKARGMVNRILDPDRARSGRAARSRCRAGNAAQACAWAARAVGVPATVVMPAAANPLEGRRVPRLRRRGRPPRRARRRGVRRAGADPRRARPDVHPPVRRPGADRGPRLGRARDPRGPAGRRRRRRRRSAAAG